MLFIINKVEVKYLNLLLDQFHFKLYTFSFYQMQSHCNGAEVEIILNIVKYSCVQMYGTILDKI